MPDIHIERSHTLGMPKARKVAVQWAERVEKAHGVRCVHTPGRGEDAIHISRTGLNGTARVTGKSFVLDMKLGFLFGLFSQRIRDGVTRELDALLGDAGEPQDAARPAAAKTAAAKSGAVARKAAPAPARAAPAKAPAAKPPATKPSATKPSAAKPPAAKPPAAAPAAAAKRKKT